MTSVSTRAVGQRPVVRGGLVARSRLSGTVREPVLASRWTGADAPWKAQDLVRVSVLMLLGFLGLGIAWFGMSGQLVWRDQMGWLVAGMASALLCGVSIVGWLLVGMRAVHTEMVELMSAVRVVHLGLPPLFDAAESKEQDSAAAPAAAGAVLVASANMTRAHRPDCVLVRGKHVEVVTDADISRRCLKPCGVCCE